MRWPEIVCGASLVALAPLAYLQWSWLGRMADAERDRLRYQLQGALDNLAREFDQEAARAQAVLMGGRPSRSASDELDITARRYSEWIEEAADPQLVRTFCLTFPGAAAAAPAQPLNCFNPREHEFQQQDWPAAWAVLRDTISHAQTVPPPLLPPIVAGDMVVFTFPRIRVDERFNLVGWMLVGFDLPYFRDKYLPALLRKHLGPGYQRQYRIGVRPRRVSSQLIFGEEIERPDAHVGILPVRPGPPAQAIAANFRGPIEGPRPAPDPEGPPLPQGLPGLDPPRDEGPPPREANRPQVPPFGPDRGRPSLWEIRVQHREGSLATLVQRTRRLNFAMSAAVLTLLGLSLGFLVISTRRAERLVQLQTDFVAGVSHELRTPLSVIRSAGENLADGVTTQPEQVKRYGALVRDEGRRLSSLVEQILSFARLQPGRTIDRQPIKLADVVDRAIESCETELRETGCTVERNIDAASAVAGDRTALTHCLRNLLANAARHGKSGGAIHISTVSRNGGYELVVEDQGEGLSGEDLAGITQPFYRGQRAKDNQIRGLGLGLTLAKRIADAHGGKLTAANRAGAAGARFAVWLPGVKS